MSRIKVRSGALATALVVLAGVFMPSVVAADSANPNGAFNVTITPTSKNLVVKPGGSVSETIQIKNQGLATEHIKVSVMKFTSDNKSGLPVLEKPGPKDAFVNWVHFSSTEFDAQPNVWTSINLTITPPKTAAFGYYYAIVFSRAQNKTQSNVANLLGSVASLILLNVQAPGELRQSQIAQFSTSKNVYEFLPVTFSIKMKNSGNVHVAPRGNIFITKGGKNVALIEVNYGLGNILPNSTRVFTANWSDGSPVYKDKYAGGKYLVDKNDNPITYLAWNNFSLGKLRFGEYHAQLVMVYNNGEGDISTQASLNFWVIPWRILAVLLLALVLIFGGLWALVIQPARRRIRGKSRGNVRFR